MEQKLERLLEIIADSIDKSLNLNVQESLLNEFKVLLGDCYDAYENRRCIMGELGIADTPEYFDQYRTRLLEHCKIALGICDRGNETASAICGWAYADISIFRGLVTKRA